MPVTKPMIKPEIGVTKPEAGVMPTKPTTAPEIAPSTVALPCRTTSATIQPSVAAAAAKCVATKALVASGPAASALPALKPYQPTHNMQAPMKLSTRLCGGICNLG